MQITGAGGISYQGNVRVLGDPVPAPQTPGPQWTYNLNPTGPNDPPYVFNVDFHGIAGTTVSFAFVGGTPFTPASFQVPGTPGVDVGLNKDIAFTVP